MNCSLKLFAIVVIVQLYIEKNNAIKCYTCSDCEKGRVTKRNCGFEDTCLTIEIEDTVIKSCITNDMCSKEGVEKQLSSWLASKASFWALFADYKYYSSCCQTDYCNGGSSQSDYGNGGSSQTDYGNGGSSQSDYGNGHSSQTDYGNGRSSQTDYGNGRSSQTDYGNGLSSQDLSPMYITDYGNGGSNLSWSLCTLFFGVASAFFYG